MLTTTTPLSNAERLRYYRMRVAALRTKLAEAAAELAALEQVNESGTGIGDDFWKFCQRNDLDPQFDESWSEYKRYREQRADVARLFRDSNKPLGAA